MGTFGLPLNSGHLVSAGMGVILTYDGLVNNAGSSDDGSGSLLFRPLAPRVEVSHKLLWRKVMPSKPMQALIDELVPLCE